MFTWNFSTHKEHSASWYIMAIIVVLSLVVYGIVEGIYIMSVVSFLFAGVYILMENNSNPITRVDIDEAGIHVGGSFYDFSSLSSFAIVYVGDRAMYLRITPRKKLSTVIDITLTQDVNPVELKNWLATHLEEEKDVKFSNSDALIHLMRL
jgi:type IV secretory pathway VirB3-like protein